MTHLPPLITDLAIILGVAAIVTFIFRKINQPIVLGYIVAGIIVGPHTSPIISVIDTQSIQTWAELGVIFLMFTLGLEFSFRRLARVGLAAGGTAIIQIIVMLILGLMAAKTLGWQTMDALFLGCMIAVSSTTIIIKALEELGLKKRKFAELVFGLLIVEDLAAILMLVALTNISLTSNLGGVDLLLASGKLILVVSAWFIVGMFLVPRVVKAVGRHKNDEMLIVVSLSLCFCLVALAGYFNYSAALGAFIMGSILAESGEVKRIEHIVQPLKDVFGAVFFVSVGMLLDPTVILNNFGAIALISFIIIAGKLFSVTIGALFSGQTVQNSIQAGFSMAQIGEFSFIIAALGLNFKVIDPKLYPIIVTTSLITTFTTPYLIKSSQHVAYWAEKKMPSIVKTALYHYLKLIQRAALVKGNQKETHKKILKWILNLVVVVSIFTISSQKIQPFIADKIDSVYVSKISAWIIAFILSSPCLWAMLNIYKASRTHNTPSKDTNLIGILISRIATIIAVGFVSLEYYPSFITIAITMTIAIIFLALCRKHIENYYQWFESQFISGFQQNQNQGTPHDLHEKLAPWDASLVEILVPSKSFISGKTISENNLRDQYGINILAIMRDNEFMAATNANERLYPNDILLCFATELEAQRLNQEMEASAQKRPLQKSGMHYELQCFIVKPNSPIVGSSLKEISIQQKYDCLLVGLERGQEKIKNPKADTVFEENDLLWIAGEVQNLNRLSRDIT